MSVSSVPVRYRDRPKGSESKLRTVHDGVRVLKTIGTLVKDYRPLPFFSLISAVLLLVSVILFLPIAAEFKATGLVPRFPTLIVSGFIAIAAIQVFGVGLTLDTQGKKSRQSFEIQMNLLTMMDHEDYVSKDGHNDG